MYPDMFHVFDLNSVISMLLLAPSIKEIIKLEAQSPLPPSLHTYLVHTAWRTSNAQMYFPWQPLQILFRFLSQLSAENDRLKSSIVNLESRLTQTESDKLQVQARSVSLLCTHYITFAGCFVMMGSGSQYSCVLLLLTRYNIISCT